MRSLVITAVVLLFSIIASVVANVAPIIQTSAMPTSSFNQTTMQEFNSQGQIVSSQTGMDQYYAQNINIINVLSSVVTGVIFFGDSLVKFGMDEFMAYSINLILGVLVAFDQLMYWGKISW
jgi:hypothetical protein